mgnify:CR=1 FL=1
MVAHQFGRLSMPMSQAIRRRILLRYRSCPWIQFSMPLLKKLARVGWVILLISMVVTVPAAAQDGATNPVCADESNTLANMIEGFVQITTGLGIMGLLVVWQADALMEMFTMGREQKAKLKQHKRGAMRSAAVLVVLGPLFTVGSAAMGLPIASCVDLIPF